VLGERAGLHDRHTILVAGYASGDNGQFEE